MRCQMAFMAQQPDVRPFIDEIRTDVDRDDMMQLQAFQVVVTPACLAATPVLPVYITSQVSETALVAVPE